ncbi:MAG TPA: hypothetical protein VLS45_06920, partial [Methylomicrobium sp.]|nr:hypothetical protein [Methylomicrobium sp.]
MSYAETSRRLLMPGSASAYVHLNANKCEVIHAPEVTLSSPIFNSFVDVHPDDACLLGAPLFDSLVLNSALTSCCESLSRAIDRLNDLSSHDALILLRASFSAPRVQHLLRCSPCVDNPLLAEFDSLLRAGMSSITNCDLSDVQWLQASLPIKEGGLGVRTVQSLALPAFLSSFVSTESLQREILKNIEVDDCLPYSDYKQIWMEKYSQSVPPTPLSHKQSAWDRPAIERMKTQLRNSSNDAIFQCRLTAVGAEHSGDWLYALPISACGLRLDDEAVRVAVGLRLGTNLCVSHTCPCGELVDASGRHSLSCKLAAGRMSRHHNLNDVIHRAFIRANIPAVKEPSGLSRTDGKRPDGVTLIPGQSGRPLTWDVTVAHTLADSYLSSAAQNPGGVAELAADRKVDKYSSLTDSLIFQP